jgi:hypothetical protein
VRELLRGKVRTVHEKIRELRALEQQLVSSLRKCERNLELEWICQKDTCPVLKDALHRGLDEN